MHPKLKRVSLKKKKKIEGWAGAWGRVQHLLLPRSAGPTRHSRYRFECRKSAASLSLAATYYSHGPPPLHPPAPARTRLLRAHSRAVVAGWMKCTRTKKLAVRMAPDGNDFPESLVPPPPPPTTPSCPSQLAVWPLVCRVCQRRLCQGWLLISSHALQRVLCVFAHCLLGGRACAFSVRSAKSLVLISYRIPLATIWVCTKNIYIYLTSSLIFNQ